MGATMKWTDRIGRRVKVRDLHVLLAVAQCGSMAKAADQLSISQPVVSKTISDLEHALGVRLLDRTSQGVEATVYGRAFIECGTAVFDELRRGVQQIEFLSDPTQGKVRIGGAGPLVDELIPAVIARLAHRYPRIEFRVTESDTPTLCWLLRERKLDLVIGRNSMSAVDEDLASDPLFDDPIFVVAGLNNPWSGRRKIALADLLHEPWCMPEPDNLAWALVVEGFGAAGVPPPTPQVVSNSMAVRLRLVESGRFLSILPHSTLHFACKRLRIAKLQVAIPMKTRPVEVITLRNRTPNPIAKLFIGQLREFATVLTKRRNENPSRRGGRQR
jgi:DNA-binding transcriptional LysR family regulator